MSKIQRTTQKIFGSNASTDDIAALGSFKTGTPVYSDDVAVLQNSAYEEGYGATLVANEAPFMEEQNSVPYILSTQIAYSLQEGIPEYDAGTTYFIGSIVKSLNENNVPVLYYSLTDNNIGNALTDDTKWKKVELGGTGGLEVGDIGLALYIDETKGLRRYLNGSILPINANTQGFLNYLKAVQLTNPEYFTTETNWQAEALLNVDGCVFKFVIDETAGTIRLPKYPEYVQIFENSAPVNIAPDGNVIKFSNSEADEVMMLGRSMTVSGVANPSMVTYPATAGSGIVWSSLRFGNQTGLTGTANLSGSTTKLKLRYFIQIATGQETEVNIINDIELNNPYTLFDSKYVDKLLYNTSWLISNGQQNSKAMYVTAYEGLAVENNTAITAGTTVTLPSGTSYTKRGLSVKLSTDSDITDYDFVINTQNETFRLPLKTKLASGSAVVGNGKTLGLTDGTTTKSLGKFATVAIDSGNYTTSNLPVTLTQSSYTNNSGIGITQDGSESGIETDSSGLSLYFYVGETIQNANLINAGRFTEALATKTDKAQAAHASMPSNRYDDLTLGASGDTYTAPAAGTFFVLKKSGAGGEYLQLINTSASSLSREILSYSAGNNCRLDIDAKKGDKVMINYNLSGSTTFFRFIYAEGAKND